MGTSFTMKNWVISNILIIKVKWRSTLLDCSL